MNAATLTPAPDAVADWLHAFKFANHATRGELVRASPAALPDADYWEAAASAWQDSERQSLTKADWRAIFDADRGDRHLLMTDAERAELAALPERITVYRGINTINEMSGLSWTLSRDVAEQFATRYTHPEWPGGIKKGTVLHHRVIALFNERDEHELLIYPRHVHGEQLKALPAQP